MTESVTIRLSGDEALVLSHMLDRFHRSGRLRLANNAEFFALSSVAAQLEEVLVEPLLPDYARLVLAARTRVAGDYQGLAPGVDPATEDLVSD